MRGQILTKPYAALTITLATAPAPLLFIAALNVPPFVPYMYIALAASMALAVGYLPRRRKPAGIVSSILLIAIYVFAGGRTLFRAYWWVPFGVFLIAFQWAAMICVTRRPGNELSPEVLIGAAIAHMVAAGIARVDLFAPVRSALWGTSIAFFVVCAFRLNDASVTLCASLRKTGAPPARVRGMNALMVSGMITLTALFANINRIGGAVRKAVSWVIAGILWLMSKLFQEGGELAPPERGGMGGLGLIAEESEQSWFAILMDRVVSTLAVIILAAGLCWLAVVVWRKAGKYIRRLIEKLRGMTDALNQVYHDEAESLFDWGEIMRAASARVRVAFRREREPRWETLDDRARVRYAVKVSLRRKPDLPAGETARSLITRGEVPVGVADADRLARDWDAARFSSTEPRDGAAENAHRALK